MTNYKDTYKKGQQIKYRYNGAWHNARITRVGFNSVDVVIYRHGSQIQLTNCTDYHIAQ